MAGKYIIGLDVGATKISAGLVYENKIPKLIKILTESEKGKEAVIKNILKAISVFVNPKVKAISVGIAGQVDSKNGVLVSSPNMSKTVKKIPLKKIIEKEFRKKTFIENDVNCFTLGEATYGAGKKYKNVIGLTLGTGIGGGIVLDKEIYHGKQGLAGEFGHMTIIENGYVCSCGKKGHLEVYASGRAMENLYYQFTGKKKDALAIEKLALRREKNAVRVVEIMSNALGIGLANIINILNPDIIIIGGGLAKAKLIWLPAILKAKREVVYPVLKTTKIVKSKLGDKASILGAALITEKK
jgi:predicted NBD/HSP70 family sugar kinase